MNTQLRTFHRHNLEAILPLIVHGINAGEFASHSDIARAFRVDRATVKRWRRRCVEKGLTDERNWRVGILQGRVARTLAA